MKRHRRGLTENPSCICCGSVESIDHILRGCPYARNVWSLIFGVNQITITFFTDDMKTWLLTNLRSNASSPYSVVPWNTLFAAICWHIWKPTSPVNTLQWRAPPQHWSCLNTDGSVCSSSHHTKTGGLLRDNIGSWIQGFGRCIGITNAFTAELWAILDGLNLAWQLGLEFIQVQTDCSKTVSKITSRDAHRSPSTLIRSIHALCQRAWVVEFIWIPREANQVADRMTKLISFSQFDMVLFTNPPAQVQDLLAKDVDGLAS
ncbi:hypothetical protein V6N13_126724 [Hibiscus sabdariffa]|uniref:RNase H type-1 domain-containing protein n=1 Tax=Hibiscus sabdariffa TaxID=183260 RepID=A0ABR2RFD0_9ROSI